jgi:predicted transcriptional regulator of viral defense system
MKQKCYNNAMKFQELVKLAGEVPCFTLRFLSAGRNVDNSRVQLNRWARNGRVIKIHNGLYTLAEPYRKIEIDSFYIAGKLKKPSYISLYSALHYYDLIPEYVPVTTSITTVRPQEIDTPLGAFRFRHISKDFFWGYAENVVIPGEQFFIAQPEKAILDLIYLTPGGHKKNFLKELRLQNLDGIKKDVLASFVKRFDRPKIYEALEELYTLL